MRPNVEMWKRRNIPHVHMCTTCANVENMCNFCDFLGTNVDFYVMGIHLLSTVAFLDSNQPILIWKHFFMLFCALNFTSTSVLFLSVTRH